MKKLSIFLLVLLLSLVLIVSCGEEKNKEKTQEELDRELLATVQLEKLEDIESYSIVIANDASDELKEKATEFISSLNEALGTDFKLKTDYSARKGTNKIVIGDSKHHTIDSEELKATDYVIKKDGESIVIIGGSERSTFEGVGFFLRNLLKTDTKEVYYPSGDGLQYVKEFKINSIKIDGVDISEFKIFALDEIEDGQKLSEEIAWNYMEINLPVEEGTALPDGDKYIILDRQSYDYYDYSMKIENGNLYIRGSYRSFQSALEHFESYLDGSHGTDVNITAKDNFEGKLEKISLPYSTKEELLAIYKYAAKQNDTLYGEHWGGGVATVGELESQLKERIGSAPASIVFDMVGCYIGNMTRSEVSQAVCELFEFASRGGIVTTFCHWQNPNDVERVINVQQIDGSIVLQDSIHRGVIGTKEQWDSLFVDGTEFNKKWKKQLDYNAEIYQAFEDLGLPVSFRPMLEANGNWFWWCANNEDLPLTGDDLRNMWNYVYDYYVDDLGLDNILWTYSPNAYGDYNSMALYYPGNDKCDLIGMDWYINENSSRDIGDNGFNALKWMNTLMNANKPMGLPEWGVTGGLTSVSQKNHDLFTCYELVDIINQAKEDGYKLAFVETYSGYFGSALWITGGEALREADGIILLEDMPEFIEKAIG